MDYKHIEIKDSSDPLVDLSDFGFILEPVYFQQGFSQDPRMFLRKEVADKLLKVQNSLGKYKFKIWDALRSRATQKAIYEDYQKKLVIEHPDWSEEQIKKQVETFIFPYYMTDIFPPHTTGGTIDLTLVDKEGKELDMGTPFDYFGPEAGALYFEQQGQNLLVKENRKMLREAMLAEGFNFNQDEWWHFDYGNQVWAKQLNKPFAIYGGASAPEI